VRGRAQKKLESKKRILIRAPKKRNSVILKERSMGGEVPSLSTEKKAQ